MADDDFQVDTRELKQMQKDYEKLKPSQAAAITRTVLNDQAFDARKASIQKSIPQLFHNRSTWIASSILVEKAKGRDISRMAALMGAKKRWGRNKTKDFDGMLEQETGASISKPGIETRMARSGSKFAGKVLGSAKLSKLSPIESETDYPGSGQSRVISMLRILDRQKFKGGIRISKSYSKFKKGIYRFKGTKIKLASGRRVSPIQMVMDLSKRRIKTPKKQWMRKGVKQGVTRTSTERSFARAFRYFTTTRQPRS